MENIYKRIWLRDETITFRDVQKVGEHILCYAALLEASNFKIIRAQSFLRQIHAEYPNHLCSIISEANSIIHLYLKELSASKSYALDALKQDSESVYSYWVLARIALIDKNYSDAIKYYENIINLFPGSDTTVLNIAEANILSRNYKVAKEYIDKAKTSTRKRLYLFFLPFRYFWVRLIWVVAMIAILAVNPYWFVFLYILATISLLYVFIQWGYRQGDLVLRNSTIYIQAINSIFFFVTICGLLNKLF